MSRSTRRANRPARQRRRSDRDILRLLPAGAHVASGLLRRRHQRMSECRSGRPSAAGDPWPVARAARAAHLSARLPGAAAATRCRPRTASSRISCPAWPTACTSTSGASTAAAAASMTMRISAARSSWRASRRGAGRQTNYPGGPRHQRGGAARDRGPVPARHRRHVHAALSHAARLGDARRCCSRSASASTTTGRAARPARCSIAARVQRRDQGCGTSFLIVGRGG